jgi:leader peptidase (prepilin peptidase) / N-methyltransferase
VVYPESAPIFSADTDKHEKHKFPTALGGNGWTGSRTVTRWLALGVWSPATVTVGRTEVTLVMALFGLIIGSFLNVVVYRVPRHLSVNTPRSFCPRCHAPVVALDNVPVLSWLVLRGRCRHCGEPISPRYPLVEGVTAVIFALITLAIGAHWAVLGCCALCATLLALGVIALDGLAPPARVALIGAGLGTALFVVAGAADHHWARLVGALIGLSAAVLVAGLVAVLHRGRRGRDGGVTDLRSLLMLVPAGTLLGWVGPLGASIAATVTIVALGALWVGRGRRHRETLLSVSLTMAATTGTAVGVAVAAALGRIAGT